MLFELPVTSDIGTKSVTPLAVTPAESPFERRAGLSSFVFHWSANPGLAIVSGEISASDRIHDVRCASAPAVSHSVVPRPTCANTAAPHTTEAIATIPRRFTAIVLYLSKNHQSQEPP